jgi:hypothetical protein
LTVNVTPKTSVVTASKGAVKTPVKAIPPAATEPLAAVPETPAPAVEPVVAGPPIVLEDGTPVRLVLSENLSSGSAATGQTVALEVVEDILVDGVVVIPRASTAWATVTDAQAKRRLGRAGKLDLNIDKVRLADGEKVLLRAVRNAKGGGHQGAMTGAIVATSLVLWPAAPLFLMMHGKDVTIPKGTEISAFVEGDVKLDRNKFDH